MKGSGGMDEDQTYMDVDGVARYIKISPNTVRQYVSKKRIPYIKLPGSNLTRFSRVLIDEWMASGHQNPKKD